MELKRRTLVKAIIWRAIGVLWTWAGAYIILLLIPPSRKTAALIATAIVAYHHSTRMVMYYIYERVWTSILWGHDVSENSMSVKEKTLWIFGTSVSIFIIFILIFVLKTS